MLCAMRHVLSGLMGNVLEIVIMVFIGFIVAIKKEML